MSNPFKTIRSRAVRATDVNELNAVIGDGNSDQLKLSVVGHDEHLAFVELSCGERSARMPLTPIEARQIAAGLLVVARQMDPGGHYALIEQMTSEIRDFLLLEAVTPAGPAN